MPVRQEAASQKERTMRLTTGSLALRLSAVALLALSAPSFAASEADGLTDSLRLTGISHAPRTGAEARHIKRRLTAAALHVCGAPSYSLALVKRSVVKSDCYRDAYAGAAAQIRWPSEQRDGQVAPD
jgi:UrcA family protein